MNPDRERRGRVASAAYRWYVAVQVVSIVGTMMGVYGAVLADAAHRPRCRRHPVRVVAAQFLPMLLFSRRAGIIVGRRRAARVVIATQSLQAAGSLALGIPLLAGWMTVWYLVLVSFAIGCVQSVRWALLGPRLAITASSAAILAVLHGRIRAAAASRPSAG